MKGCLILAPQPTFTQRTPDWQSAAWPYLINAASTFTSTLLKIACNLLIYIGYFLLKLLIIYQGKGVLRKIFNKINDLVILFGLKSASTPLLHFCERAGH